MYRLRRVGGGEPDAALDENAVPQVPGGVIPLPNRGTKESSPQGKRVGKAPEERPDTAQLEARLAMLEARLASLERELMAQNQRAEAEGQREPQPQHQPPSLLLGDVRAESETRKEKQPKRLAPDPLFRDAIWMAQPERGVFDQAERNGSARESQREIP